MSRKYAGRPYNPKNVIKCNDTGETISGDKYLQSKHWANMRLKIFKKYNGVCQRCRSIIPMEQANIHHITYKRIGNEKESDLILLCKKCHACNHKAMRNKKEQNKTIQYYISQLDKEGKDDVIKYIQRKYDL